MLIAPATAHGIADGSVTLAFRRWDAPRMRPGSTQRTVAGVVEVTTLDVVDPERLTEDDAARAGIRSLAELLQLLDRRAGAHVYRMRGPAGRARSAGRAARAGRPVRRRAARDRRAAGPHGRRPRSPLDPGGAALISAQPGVRAPDLAASLGRETLPFKRDVRKLKELGLTCSLPVGYEISHRGRAYLG